METSHRRDALKLSYRKKLELATIASLLLVFGFLHALPGPRFATLVGKLRPVKIEVEDVVPTFQFNKPLRPLRPRVTVPNASESMPEHATIHAVAFELVTLPPAPELKNPYEEYTFIPHEIPPEPVGGMVSIQKRIQYPDRALAKGIEGLVVIGVLVDEQGKGSKISILHDSGMDAGFEEAAATAVNAVSWVPAQQREKAVKVWIAVPVRFRISARRQQVGWSL